MLAISDNVSFTSRRLLPHGDNRSGDSRYDRLAPRRSTSPRHLRSRAATLFHNKPKPDAIVLPSDFSFGTPASPISPTTSVSTFDSWSSGTPSLRSTIRKSISMSRLKSQSSKTKPNGIEINKEEVTVSSAKKMDISTLKRCMVKPKQIIVTPRACSRPSSSSGADSPKVLPHVRPVPPRLNLDRPKTAGCSVGPPTDDLSPVSPFSMPTMRLPPCSNESRHSQVADSVGVQMLLQTLSQDSDDDGSGSEFSNQPYVNASGRRPSLARIEIPMPSIDESGETSSEASILSDFAPSTPSSSVFADRRHSDASTVPTSISSSENSAVGEVPYLDMPKDFSFKKSRHDVPFMVRFQPASDLDFPSRRCSTASSISPPSPCTARSSSVVSSVASFCCQGGRASFLNGRNNSIGFGSIAASDIDLEAGLEDSTVYPGVEALKQQMSWLSLHNSTIGCNIYDDFGEDHDMELLDYHWYLSSMVPGRDSITNQPISPTTPPTAPINGTPIYPQALVDPPSRRLRRRTASSECLITDVLEEMKDASTQPAVEQPQPPVVFKKLSLLKGVGRLQVAQDNHDSDPNATMWDSEIFGSTVAWDQLLDRDTYSLGMC